MTVIKIEFCALETIPKCLIRKLEELEIEGWSKTIQTTERPEYREEF